MPEVRESLRKLFKADDAQMARLFSGRPVVIRRNLDSEAASRYQQILLKAGAIVEVRPVEGAEASSTESQAQDAEDQPQQEGLVLAPVGADILKRTERPEQEEVEVDTSKISLAPVGSDVLQGSERSEPEELEVDTSHLSVESPPKGQ